MSSFPRGEAREGDIVEGPTTYRLPGHNLFSLASNPGARRPCPLNRESLHGIRRFHRGEEGVIRATGVDRASPPTVKGNIAERCQVRLAATVTSMSG